MPKSKTSKTSKKINKKMLLAAWSSNNKYWHGYQAFYIPFKTMFKELSIFDPQEETYKHGRKIMNKKFLEVLKKEKPDYIMMFLVWDEFTPETLLTIKKILPKVKVVHWTGDDDIKFENFTIPYSSVMDYTFMSQLQFSEKYKEYGLPIFDTLAADTKKFIPLNLKKKNDVCFVGSPKGDRAENLIYLAKNNVDFVLYGSGWDEYTQLKRYYKGKVSDEDFIKLINETKINLCFSKNYFNSRHVIERSLEVNACKSFALTDYVKGYFSKFKEGFNISTFKDKKEMLEKIKYFLKHEKERERIAERAYKETVKKYSNVKMMGDAFKVIEADTKELQSINSRQYLKKKLCYIKKEDLGKGKDHLQNKTQNFEYISFEKKGCEALPHRDFFQIYPMAKIKKPISICDLQLSSSIIGDYACLSLEYATKYHKDKKSLYENMDISQFVVEKSFFMKNIKKFEELFNGAVPKFLTDKNSFFISIPLVRTKKIKRIPLRNVKHILFTPLDLNLLVLRNQKKLLKKSYIYRLLFYSIFINPQIFKHLLVNSLPRTKNARLKKISEFFNKLL